MAYPQLKNAGHATVMEIRNTAINDIITRIAISIKATLHGMGKTTNTLNNNLWRVIRKTDQNPLPGDIPMIIMAQ